MSYDPPGSTLGRPLHGNRTHRHERPFDCRQYATAAPRGVERDCALTSPRVVCTVANCRPFEFSMPTILVLGTNAGQADLIRYMKMRDWHVIACAHRAGGPGEALCDKFELVDVRDVARSNRSGSTNERRCCLFGVLGRGQHHSHHCIGTARRAPILRLRIGGLMQPETSAPRASRPGRPEPGDAPGGRHARRCRQMEHVSLHGQTNEFARATRGATG